ncbi:MAG: metallophosphoesterase [Bryobacterales bacterium]|nr:metallophosphoesterase [Bryobacterales bacterium]
MRILLFSDIHSDLRTLERLAATPADLYVCAGDLVSWARGLDACADVLRPLGSSLHVLPGNHESAGQIEAFCDRYGFTPFHERTKQVGRYTVAGLGYSSPTPFNTPGEYTEEQLEDKLAAFHGLNPLVLVCHAPPFGTSLDRIEEGLHAGSRSVRAFVEAAQPEYFFCGHIHESEGVTETIGRTVAVNLGKRGYLLDLEDEAV